TGCCRWRDGLTRALGAPRATRRGGSVPCHHRALTFTATARRGRRDHIAEQGNVTALVGELDREVVLRLGGKPGHYANLRIPRADRHRLRRHGRGRTEVQ